MSQNKLERRFFRLILNRLNKLQKDENIQSNSSSIALLVVNEKHYLSKINTLLIDLINKVYFVKVYHNIIHYTLFGLSYIFQCHNFAKRLKYKSQRKFKARMIKPPPCVLPSDSLFDRFCQVLLSQMYQLIKFLGICNFIDFTA